MIAICQHCKVEFDVKPARVKVGKGKYCSKECYTRAIRRDRENKKRVCQICGTEFFASQSQIYNGAGKFCSQKCHGLSIKGKKQPNTGVHKICEVCGSEFKTTPSNHRRGHGRFCSKKCMGVSMGVSQKGEVNPAWRGGVSFEPYCQKFTKEFKERIRAYFDYTCIECRTPQNGSKLRIHHVNYDKMVCCNETKPLFVPLCQSCHSKTNFNRPYWERHFTDIINQYYEGKCYLPKEVTA